MRKKEKYIHRWLREHPKLQVYLKKEEYEWLKGLADERKTSMKEIVFKAIREAEEFYDKGYYKGYFRGFESGKRWGAQLFINNPPEFYKYVMKIAEEMGLSDFEPCLFVAPCYICGEPIVFTHEDKDWTSEVRPTLLNAFKEWYHTRCEET